MINYFVINKQSAQISYLSSLGGENTQTFVGRIFSALFTFKGRKPGNRAFYGSPINELVLGRIQLHNLTTYNLDVFQWCNTDLNSDRRQLEKAFKNAFEKAHDRLQKGVER
uniref:Uncharacterized protein n=1 Tax=Schistocephalus solidus TaxID=70667 RepID=A0A0X3Q286_SCHSO